MSRHKVFAKKFRDPVSEIIVKRLDESAPISVEGMSDGEGGVSAIVGFREVWGL